jgi:hypothetical protein
MATISKSPTQSNPIAETRREGPTYYKSLVKSGYAPVNGLQLYYESTGRSQQDRWSPFTRFSVWRTCFPR